MNWGYPHYCWFLLLIAALGAIRFIWARAVRRRYAGIGAGEPSFTRAVGARLRCRTPPRIRLGGAPKSRAG